MRDEAFSAAVASIKAAQHILLVTHLSPDGDAIGSLVGLTLALRDMGKRASAAVDDGLPPSLAFIPGSDAVQPSHGGGSFDLCIALDAGDMARTGTVGAYGWAHCQRSLNIDHHPTNTLFADINLVEPRAVATAEIVYDLLQEMGSTISKPVATALLAGIISDSQGFRIPATSSRTLQIAQELMACGVSLPELMMRTVASRSYTELQLWKRVLPSVELTNGVASASIRQADLRSAGLGKMTDGGLVNFLLEVRQARLAVVFKELPQRQVEVSFRAKPGYPVGPLAQQLGGGGHRLAAGCTLPGRLQEIRERVLPLTQRVIENGKPDLA